MAEKTMIRIDVDLAPLIKKQADDNARSLTKEVNRLLRPHFKKSKRIK